KHRTVRGAVGSVPGRTVDGVAGGELPAAAGEAGGDRQGRWPDPAAGHPGGEGPGRADGGEARDRTDLRGGVRGRKLRLPPRPPWRRSGNGWPTTAFICIRTRRTSATAASLGKASTSSAIGSKPASGGSAARA